MLTGGGGVTGCCLTFRQVSGSHGQMVETRARALYICSAFMFQTGIRADIRHSSHPLQMNPKFPFFSYAGPSFHS